MNYPDGFNVPAFPAGTHIATSRVAGIGILIVSLLIVFMCGMILWATSARTVDPFIISVNPITRNWEVVGHSHGQNEFSTAELAQMATVNRFVQGWFQISSNKSANDARWTPCTDEQCLDSNSVMYDGNKCSLYCMADADLFADFVENVVPDYRDRAANGQILFVKPDTIQITPVGKISDTDGHWRVTATIQTNVDDFQILAYAHVVRSAATSYETNATYPLNYVQTLGFQIVEFKSYKID